MVVCVFDDNRLVLDALTVALKDEGYAVFAAQTWPEAEAVLKSLDVGAVVTDLEMPNLMTAEIVSRVRACFASVPIIAMSGSADPGVGDQAKANGADLFLPKPVSAKILANALGRLIQARLKCSRNVEAIDA